MNDSGNYRINRIILSLTFLFLAGVFLPVHFSLAAASTWTGAVSADWATAGNWSLNAIPTSADNVTIPDAGTTNNDPNISAGAVAGSVTIASGGILNGNAYIITVNGNWTNSGTFNHGSGTVVFGGSSNMTFTPGASVYNNIGINKTNGDWDYDHVSVSGTATVSGNLVHTDGRMIGGQIDLAGNYTVTSSAGDGRSSFTATVINFNHASNSQSIIYSAGGVGAQIRVDKAGGSLNVSSDIVVSGWTYVQGSVVGLDTYKLILGGNANGNFVPGSLVYGNLEINKTNSDLDYDHVSVSGTATVSGILTHTNGRLLGGQINLAGDYVIGASASGSLRSAYATVVNLNHATNNQQLTYNAGGEGAEIRIDKAGGTFSILSDIIVSGWTYVQGTVTGVSSRTITFAGYGKGNFAGGWLTYGNIVLNKIISDTDYDDLYVSSGTLSISGYLTVTDGQMHFQTNNPTVTVTGDITIAAAGTLTAGTNTITVNGNWTNSGTFSHGNGMVKFAGSDEKTFTPGSSSYNNLEFSKGINTLLMTSGTATVLGNFTHTSGQMRNGQFNVSGNYIIGASARGAAYISTVINLNSSGNQQIVYTAGGVGAQVRVDKAGGTLTISDNIVINGWIYIQGTVAGLNSYALIFGDDEQGYFTPGALTYNNIELRKTGTDILMTSGTAIISGNFTHTDGQTRDGQFDIAGNYIIGSLAGGAAYTSTVMNFNSSADQQIIYNAGGIGSRIRIDKTSGSLTISNDIVINGWIYIQGTVVGLSSYSLTFGDDEPGYFTHGGLTYKNIELNKTGTDQLYVSAGTITISGNLTITDGQWIMNGNNPTVNIGGNVAIAAAGTLSAGSNTITINGDWTNSGTFSHGNGKIVFVGSSNETFTPGSSTYNNIEINKTNHFGIYDNLSVSGTATLVGNLIQTEGELVNGQFNLTVGNYVVPATSDGTQGGYTTTIINFNGTGNQTVVYTAEGIAANIRIDKTSGNFVVPSDMIMCSWIYVQGAVVGLDSYALIFGDDNHGYFTPGNLVYSEIELNKPYTFDDFVVSGTATVSGNFIHTDGDFNGGQINLTAGNYIIGSLAAGVSRNSGVTPTIMNFNGSGDQAIVYTAGGVGTSIRVDKPSGNLTIADNIEVNGWDYIRGTVVGLDAHTLILGDDKYGSFTSGGMTYGSIEVKKTNHTGDFDDLNVAGGTININGNFTLTEGQVRFDYNNPILNLTGNFSIGSANATFTRGTGTLTFNGTTSSIFTDLSATPQNIGNIVINKTNTTETQNRLTLASSLTCNTLSIDGTSGQADTLDLGNGEYTLTLANAGNTANVFTVNGTATPGDGTIKYAATNSAGNINIAPISYDNLELSGAETYALAGIATLTGNLIIGANSTLLAGANTLNLSGNFTNSGTFTPGTSTVILTGTNQSLSGNTAFYNLTKDITTSDTLTFAADSTTTINPSGTLTLKGQDRDNRLSLISSTPDTEWNLAVNDASIYDFDFLNVQDSNATTRHLSVLNSLDAGNNTNWTIVNNTATGITVPSINVAGSIVTIHTTASDTDHDNISLKLEYSIDNGSTWHDPYLSSTTASAGTPTLNNTSEYQITAITTASDNTVTILWDTKSEQNELSSILFEDDIKIRITPYDGTDIGSSQPSLLFEVNNRSAVFVPSIKPDISDTQISSDNNILHLANLPADIIQIAISSTSDFQEVSYQDIAEAIDISNFNSDTIYFKFRTSQGSTSDTITYNRTSRSISSDIKEGDIVKTKDNFDVYIIKYKNGKQYKRLILSPSVFNSYHHLKWENIKIISQSEMDRYVTSNLVKETTDVTIFELFPNGDIGERRKLDISKPYDADSVYEINRVDRDSYLLVK